MGKKEKDFIIIALNKFSDLWYIKFLELQNV